MVVRKISPAIANAPIVPPAQMASESGDSSLTASHAVLCQYTYIPIAPNAAAAAPIESASLPETIRRGMFGTDCTVAQAAGKKREEERKPGLPPPDRLCGKQGC